MSNAEDRYRLFLDGSLYGVGPYSYIEELLRDYIVASKMYGRSLCEFAIVKQ